MFGLSLVMPRNTETVTIAVAVTALAYVTLIGIVWRLLKRRVILAWAIALGFGLLNGILSRVFWGGIGP